MTEIKYIEYNGQPVISARNLYAYLTDGAGDNIGAWLSFCGGHFLFTDGEDTFRVTTDQGHPDILLLPTAAAALCTSFRNTPERAKTAFNMIREFILINTVQEDSNGSKTGITINHAAKILSYKGGPNALYAMLRTAKVLTKKNIPMQNYVDGGYFQVAQARYRMITGGVMYYAQTQVTPKGIEFIKQIISKKKTLSQVA